MLVKILGAIDVIGGILLFLIALKIELPQFILILFAVLFGLKSLFIFSGDVASVFDLIACGMFIVSNFAFLPIMIPIISGVLVLQKGVFSFLG